MVVPEPLDPQRNSPRQERARQTVATFFEATAQLLERAEERDVTTNHVAERAGFSVGTLYRYFSGKSSLFKAMALHEMERQERNICAALAATDATLTADIVRLVIRPTLQPFEGRSAVRRALLRAALNLPGLPEHFDRMITRVSRALVDTVVAKATDCARRPSPEAEFVMLRAVIGSIRSDVLFGGRRVGQRDFEETLIGMVASFFKK